MDAIEWLSARHDGFAGLSTEARHRIAEFTLTWTYFEATVLATQANAQNIVALAQQMDAERQIKPDRLAPIASYFRTRYVTSGKLTHHYPYLHFRQNDHEELVQRVLLGETNAAADLLAASLLIAFRYRNNLFHGLKWADGIEDQRGNFETAIELLMAVMEMRA